MRRAGRILERHRLPAVATAAFAIAIPTRGITVHSNAILAILGAGIALLFWWAATDPKLGRRIGESRLLNFRAYQFPILPVLVSLLFSGLLFPKEY